MTGLRRHLRMHPQLAAMIVAAALLMRLLVPAGFMPVFAGGQVTVGVCAGQQSGEIRVAIPMKDHGAATACAFSDLSLPMLAGADPIQLAAAIAYALAVALVLAITLPARRIAHLRPPLRGPPAPRSFA